MKRDTNKTRLQLEALDERCVPAGNVTACYVDGATFVVAGDADNNEVRVVFDGPQTGYIEGLNGTTVNGQSSIAFGATNDGFVVDLSAGDDVLTVEALVTPYTEVRLETGNGDDSVEVNFHLPAGPPRTWFWRIDTGNGDDHVSVHGGSGITPSLYLLSITTGNGNDDVAMDGSLDLVALYINLGNGDDALTGGGSGTITTQGYPGISGGNGFDTAVNLGYFGVLPGDLGHGFEVIVN